jgi:hypothetical protein
MVCRVHTLLRGFFIFLDAWSFVNASGETAGVGGEVFAHLGLSEWVRADRRIRTF